MKKFACILLFMSSYVFGGGYFSVDEVEVRVQAKNSFIAQQMAKDRAMSDAFSKMLRINFPEVSAGSFKTDEISRCVYDYSIDREKRSGKVFIGKFSFRFVRSAVVQLLRNRGVEIAQKEDSERVTLIAPISYAAKITDLMERYNISIIKFNKDKIMFEANKQDFDNIKANVRCVMR